MTDAKQTRTRREVSPAINATSEEYFAIAPSAVKGIIRTIRAEKDTGTRSKPSASLIDRSLLLTPGKRAAILDYVASLVDENLTGRSDMCCQFAILVDLALSHIGIESYPVEGIAIYFSQTGEEIYRWKHAWVRIGSEVIDGNSDSVAENIKFPKSVQAPPYWGPIKEIPGRRLKGYDPPTDDPDVSNDWWPRLREWLDNDFQQIS